MDLKNEADERRLTNVLNNVEKLVYLMKDAHGLHLSRVTAQFMQLVLSQQELLGDLIFV